MLRDMRRIRKSSHDLIAAELIIIFNIFDLFTGGESTKHSCYIDSCALYARLAEADGRVHRNTRIDFHRIPHSNLHYIQYALRNSSFLERFTGTSTSSLARKVTAVSKIT